MATRPTVLTWKIPWIEESGRLQVTEHTGIHAVTLRNFFKGKELFSMSDEDGDEIP